MKKKILILLVVLVVVAAATYVSWKFVFHKDGHAENIKQNTTLYHCSMHPWVTSDKPGKCPICGMDLVPVKTADEFSSEGVVRINPVMIQNIGVKKAVVESRLLTHQVRTTGRVDYDETRQSIITTKFPGYIEKLYVDYVGKPVQKGQPLFEIYSADLVAAEQEYIQALHYRETMLSSGDSLMTGSAGTLVESARRKLAYWDISSQQLKALAKSGIARKTLTIYSPFSGVVTEKNVFDGMEVQAGMNLLKLSQTSNMWVYADVYQSDLAGVRVGDKAHISLPERTDNYAASTVSFIDPFTQNSTRTTRVRIEVPNPDQFLKKDMYVTVNIYEAEGKAVPTVPELSVIHSGVRDIVVKSLGHGTFKPVEVTLGSLADGYYEVKNGLAEGDTIVTSSQFLIDSESNLRSSMSQMSGMPGMGDQDNTKDDEKNN